MSATYFGIHWRFVPVVAVWPLLVVVTRQIAQHVRLSLPLAGIAVLRHPLRFQASEKTLHRCVIPAVATAAHALFDPVAPQHLAKLDAGVMTALVGVKHQLLWAATRLKGHAQGPRCELRVRSIG